MYRKKFIWYTCVERHGYTIFFYLGAGEQMANEILMMIISVGISAIVGIIGYFLKATMNRVDKAESKLQVQEINKAERTELSELRDDLKELNDKFATKEEVREVKETMSKITKDIDFIKEKSVRSDEFVRVIGRLESKLDDLLRR